MTQLDFESDAFLTLLTDALRAGPGSPQWHDALQHLRERGIEQDDEYQLLVTAREHLESGKGYRALRAGPGFTQKLMHELDQEPDIGGKKPKAATSVAVFSGAAMVLVILIIGALLWHASDSPDDAGAPMLLPNIVESFDFSASEIAQWRRIGKLPFEMGHGAMRYIADAAATASGGGLVWDKPIPADEPFSVVITLREPKVDEKLIAELFVTEDPNFNDENGLTSREWVWLLQGNQAQVILPGGRLETKSDSARDSKGNVLVRVTIQQDKAWVNLRGKQFWTGPHGLDPTKPRYLGIRFLRRDQDALDSVSFTSLRLNMRQP